MGKGIALQFKEAFPQNNKAYIAACKAGELRPGVLLPVWDGGLHGGRKLIVNFPTKTNWRMPSRYEYIEDGLVALRALIIGEGISSIAVPPLGCGNGGLDWERVKPMIEQHLGDLDARILVYEPNADIKAVLQEEAPVRQQSSRRSAPSFSTCFSRTKASARTVAFLPPTSWRISCSGWASRCGCSLQHTTTVRMRLAWRRCCTP